MEHSTQVAVLAEQVRQLNAHLESTDEEIEKLKSQRTSALVWGIIVLGSGFVGLATWIFNLVAGHAK